MGDDLERALEYRDFDEMRVRHLEQIQEVVSRLGSNGFLVRGWAVTLSVALLGFAVENRSIGLAVLSLAPTLSFWALDAYILRAERLFRHLYDRVRVRDETIPPFYMSATALTFAHRAPRDVRLWRSTLMRPVLVGLYGSLTLTGVALAVVLACASA